MPPFYPLCGMSLSSTLNVPLRYDTPTVSHHKLATAAGPYRQEQGMQQGTLRLEMTPTRPLYECTNASLPLSIMLTLGRLRNFQSAHARFWLQRWAKVLQHWLRASLHTISTHNQHYVLVVTGLSCLKKENVFCSTRMTTAQ